MIVLGVGSELRGDDAAGLLVAEKLLGYPGLDVIIGGTAPENFTGEIKKKKASLLFIVDAAEMNEAPGTVKIIPLEQIAGYNFTTHALPLSVMINYLQIKAVVIGIQPKSTAFGATVSDEVKKAVEKAAAIILNWGKHERA